MKTLTSWVSAESTKNVKGWERYGLGRIGEGGHV